MADMSAEKAPGGDGLTLDICRRAYRCDKDLLIDLFTQCLRRGCFPKVWKVAIVKIIPKPLREDYSSVKSYRPIGLLPVFGKMLEKLFVNRLRWQLGREQRLSPLQYGFTQQRSAEDALYDALAIVRKGLEDKKMVVMVSLDIEGAFDNAWWPAIVAQLRLKGVDAGISRLIINYLSERSVKLRYAGEMATRDTNRGCIQGSICGPILWNIQLDPVLEQSQYCGVRVQAFADDILMIAVASDGYELEGKINRALQTVLNWGANLKLRFSAPKTQALFLTKKLKFHLPEVYMAGVHIPFSSNIRVLGLFIDSTLNFREHLEQVTRKAIAFYKVVARAARAQWGLNSQILRMIYVAVVEPTILYSASCWAGVSDKVYVNRSLSSLGRSFAIKISKAHRTVSYIASMLLARILPLPVRLKENATVYGLKKGGSLVDWPGKKLEIRKSPFVLPHPGERISIVYKLINSREDIETVSGVGPVFYTDGSKLDGKVGGAVTCWSGGGEVDHFEFALEDYCSVFQAELCAISRALSMITNRAESSFSIASDCRSGLEVVCDSETLHPIAAEIREHIRRLSQSNKSVQLYWVRAHCGFEGNERADALAKLATSTSAGPTFYDKFPLSYAKYSIRSASLVQWQRIYENAQAGSTTRLFFRDVSTSYKALGKMSLNNFVTQILTGHGGFKFYLHRFKLLDSPFCSCDRGVFQTVQHLLIDCVRFGRLRLECEFEMDCDISLFTLDQIMADDDRRMSFLGYARTILRIIGRENGSFIEPLEH